MFFTKTFSLTGYLWVLHIIPFKKIVTYMVGLFMFKLNKGFLPKVISEQFLKNSDVHHYKNSDVHHYYTRQKNHLHASKEIYKTHKARLLGEPGLLSQQ